MIDLSWPEFVRWLLTEPEKLLMLLLGIAALIPWIRWVMTGWKGEPKKEDWLETLLKENKDLREDNHNLRRELSDANERLSAFRQDGGRR